MKYRERVEPHFEEVLDDVTQLPVDPNFGED
jgi:hypothetical protein